MRRDVERLGEASGQPIDPKELEPINQALIEQAAGVTAAQVEAAQPWRERLPSVHA